ncbi:unnamed protein product [Albugo candida]|uniref:6-phosphofructo-2-kinase domain-containing protein n=1 Tax=Albugo candida TaxID=65357 RepID=A0A024GP21_9STRA|nr:unnamed protein product [Albugo candida]|eukprot:CCI48526.1 unnamed protein product [Albugo candida]
MSEIDPIVYDPRTVTHATVRRLNEAASSRSKVCSRSLSERKIFTPTPDKLVLVMVGLPARGKSFIAKKLWKFLCWKGFRCKVFNVGQVRRSFCTDEQDHRFFDPLNEKGKEAREQLAMQVLEQVKMWFLSDSEPNKCGDVAIFDATNTTKQRRRMLMDSMDEFAKQHDFFVYMVYIESICTKEAVINANIAQKIAFSPDYAKFSSSEDAIHDLKLRMQNYERAYQVLTDEEELSYIKLFDLQSKVHVKGIYGHVAKSILPYMMSFHIEHRPIWLVRAGHCNEMMTDFTRVVKDPCAVSRSAHLSALGLKFARSLADFVQERTEVLMHPTVNGSSGINAHCQASCLVMTSTLPRAVETAEYLPHEQYKQYATLNPLDKGECYGMSMEQIQDELPEFYTVYMRDPWKARFPGGESYFDLMLRLEPILIDIEQHTGPVILISHISTLQVLYSYFLGIPIEKCSSLEIPFHSVLELLPNQDGWNKKIFSLDTTSN